MIDPFSMLAPVYERVIPPPAPGALGDLLELTPGSVLLDAAGGTGRVSAVLAPGISRVVVCDASKGMLREAARKGLETVLAKIEELPFEDASFDSILLVDAYHHLEDQRIALGELLRVLKPSGRLVIEEPDVRRPFVKVLAILEKIFLMRSHFVRLEKMIETITDQGGCADLARNDWLRVWLIVTKVQ